MLFLLKTMNFFTIGTNP